MEREILKWAPGLLIRAKIRRLRRSMRRKVLVARADQVKCEKIIATKNLETRNLKNL